MEKDDRTNLIELMKQRLGKSSAETTELLKGLSEDIIAELLKGKTVSWHNMFSLNLSQGEACLRRNPLTDEQVIVPPRKSIRFKTGKVLEEMLSAEVAEKHILMLTLLTAQPAKLQALTRPLAEHKIITQFVPHPFAQTLKEQRIKTRHISLALIDFPPTRVEYDEFTFLCKIDKSLPQSGLVGVIPDDVNPLKIRGLKILCDQWVKTSTSPNKLMETILSEIERAEERQLFFKEHLRIRLPTQDNYLERLAPIIEQLIKRTGLSAERSNEFIPAVREAIANGAYHGNKNDKNKYLEIEYSVDKQKVLITITDEGTGFDYETVLKKAESPVQDVLNQAAAQSSRDSGGLGIVLMKKCADELSYVPPGNILSLTKYLKMPKKGPT